MAERNHATQYVFLAVGGTGAKVAEAFINLMSIGVPMAAHNSEPYSSLHQDDRLRIMRIDPDKGCRADSLQLAVKRYRAIQKSGGQAGKRGLWGLNVSELEVVAPLEALEGPTGIAPTLRNQLASADPDGSVARMLRAFYKTPDLDTALDRGFFQKAHIGSSIIGSGGEAKAKSVSKLLDTLKELQQSRVRVFIAGSIFGGTGAAGLPVIGRIVKSFIDKKGLGEKWKVAGCLLGPYFYPPQPPIDRIDWGGWSPKSDEEFDDFLERTKQTEEKYLNDVVERAVGKGHHAENRDYQYDEVRQIARGYFAKPEETERRALAAWKYYQRHGKGFFDNTYLLGMGSPTDYDKVSLEQADFDEGEVFSPRIQWANGGKDQVAPLHALEYAAACCAMHCFVDEGDHDGVISMGGGEPADGLRIGDLAASTRVEVSKWLASSLVGTSWLRHSLLYAIDTPEKYAAAQNMLKGLYGYLKEDDFQLFRENLQVIAEAMRVSLLHTTRALGWNVESRRVLRDWYRDSKKLGKKGGFLSKKSKDWDIGDWRLDGVDATTIGATIPRQGRLQSGSTEGLALIYLRDLWSFAHEGFRPLEEGN